MIFLKFRHGQKVMKRGEKMNMTFYDKQNTWSTSEVS